MYAKILKANPYHDEQGRFTTKENDLSGGGDLALEHGTVVSYEGKAVYRASDTGDANLATGGRAALGEGYYFGLSKGDVEGYGATVKQHKLTGKFVEVQGDKGFDEVKDLAGMEAKDVLDKHLADVATGKPLDPDLLARASSGKAYLPTYLKSKGIAGVVYKHKESGDHHDQVVVYDSSAMVSSKFENILKQGGKVSPSPSSPTMGRARPRNRISVSGVPSPTIWGSEVQSVAPPSESGIVRST